MEPRFFSLMDHPGPLIGVIGGTLRDVVIGRKPMPTCVEIDLAPGNRRWREMWMGMEPALILREDVADAMLDLSLGGANFADVVVRENHSSLPLSEMPKYRCLVPSAGIDLDFEAAKSRQQAIGGSKFNQPTIPILRTWNGADLFACANREANMIWCTRRVLELARASRWKNFKFCPMDLRPNDWVTFNRSKGIDYLGKTRSPEWYPPGYSPEPENCQP